MDSHNTSRGGRTRYYSDDRGSRFTRQSPSNHRRYQPFHRKHPMSFLHLKGLLKKDPLEVTLALKSERSGFKELLCEGNLGKEKMTTILNVLALACTCPRKENLSETLKMVNEVPAFLRQLETFLEAIEKASGNNFSALSHLATFLEGLRSAHPITSKETIERFLPRLKQALSRHKDFDGLLQNRLNLLSNTAGSAGLDERCTQDFRNVSVFPSCIDFEVDPYLRPNVVTGKYDSVGHYLDVQFRLFREDYVRPLRAGIISYRKQTADGVKSKFKDVRVYRNVRISEALLTVDDGVVHKVLFDYDGPINWESSKRLIYGSLLCLSTDGFQSLLVATVVASKPYELRQGIVYLRFAEEHMEEAHKLKNRRFVAIETDAYFEAYRHVLTVLQEFECESFPLKEYIVYVKTEPRSPNYLSPENQYCFNSLTDLTFWGKMEGILFNLANMMTKEKGSVESTCKCLTSEILQLYSAVEVGSWPSEDELSLDHSQVAAFKSALTQKLSVIQGPPGTGKTHVGLKIVNALLHNQLYSTSKYMKYPILVVCFTNHALDQFLEGVVKLTKKVVRVGGRSTSTILANHSLKHLKRNSCNDFTKSYRFSVRDSLKSSISRIKSLQKLINDSVVRILSEMELEKDIPEHHLRSLYRDHPACLELSFNPGNFIRSWLGSWFPAHFFIEHEGLLYLWLDEVSSCEELIPMLEDMAFSEILYTTLYGNVPFEKSFEKNQHRSFKMEPPEAQQVHPHETQFFTPKHLDEVADVDFIRAERMEDQDIFQDAEVIYDTSLPSLGCFEKTFVFEQLCCEPISEVESVLCRNVWSLRLPERWRLYKYWLMRFHAKIQDKINEEKKLYNTNLKLYDELRQERERLVTQDYEVVGMTTTGAAKYKHLMKGLKPRVVIVEEAAEVLEAHVISSLSENTQHLILIGDHQQLRPNPACYELAKDYGLDVSLFERLISNGLPFVRLGIQHRMRPCISQLLVPHIYKCLVDHSTVFEYEDVFGMEKNVSFLSHVAPEDHSCTSKSNSFEAKYIIALCKHLLLQGYESTQITILATYLAQFALIKRLASEDKHLNGVKITVVDNYQGEENDIILLSFVRSNSCGSIGFLKTENRVCVALSRAKKGLYCVGNFDLLANESTLWSNITSTLKANNSIGSSINAKCENHGTVFSIRCADDFNHISGGGCTRPCEFRLECGHVCAKLCHPIDKNHEKYKCQLPCMKVNESCEFGHRCTKVCCLKCGSCVYRIPKILQPCLHEVFLPCSTDPKYVACQLPCPEYLPCGHRCPSKCGMECPICMSLVSKISPCGHTVKVACNLSNQEQNLRSACTIPCSKNLSCGHPCSGLCGSECVTYCPVLLKRRLSCGHYVKVKCSSRLNEYELLKQCSSPCISLLECGHVCKGSCGQCAKGRLHIPCEEKHDRKLICGHIIKNSSCSRSYPPCKEKCRNSCFHRRCPLPCGCTCLPCKEPCAWKCEHMSCSRACGEPCDRPPCNQACPKTLPCGHECLGWCGELCPQVCAYCSTVSILQISGLTRDQVSDTTDRLVVLERCDHVFKWTELEAQLQEQQRSHMNRAIFKVQAMVCPLCQAPFGRIGRLGAMVHGVQASIEQVKRKVFGSRPENSVMCRHLLNRITQAFLSTTYLKLEEYVPEIASLKGPLVSRVSNKTRSILRPVLVFAENYVTILEKMSSTCYLLLRREDETSELRQIVRYALGDISKIMVLSLNSASHQLIRDLELELRRLTLLVHVEFDHVENSPLQSSRFQGDDQDEETLSDTVKKLPVLENWSNFASGNWYRCSVGHVFYVTPCVKEADCFICHQSEL